MCEDFPPEFDRAIAAVDYTSPWRELISQLKFQGHVGVAKTLAPLMIQAIRQQPKGSWPQLIIPTPLSASRLRERGYNQSWLLAQRLSKSLRIPCLQGALIRTKDTPRMMSLEADERRRLIRDAFEVPAKFRRALVGRHVAVVDDVLTTGSTLNEMSLTLSEAGVKRVSAWVMARTDTPG